MQKRWLFSFLSFALLSLISISARAQSPLTGQDFNTNLLLAQQLMEENRFMAARVLINQLPQEQLTETQRAEMEFLKASVALKMDEKEAPEQVDQFEFMYPTFSRIEELRNAKGDYFFNHGKYKNAAEAYAGVKASLLNTDDRNAYFFKYGYSQFMLNNPKEAKNLFYKVKDSKSTYAPSATYYYAHINYDEKNFPSALKGFLSLKDDPTFKAIAPYYICQIYYQEKDYEKLLEIGPQLFKDAQGPRKNEIAKILGDAHFKLEQYPQSIEYLEFYRANSQGGYQKSDYYQLAFAHMKAGNNTEAIKYFEKVGNKQDSLSQYTLYNLGTCYLKTQQKEFAGKAFYAAYQLDVNQEIREDALFNFAKISYELSNDPYNRAITAINSYLEAYPKSTRKKEAYSYLVNLFLSSKNYKGALVAIENIEDRTPELNKAYQLIAFNRAIELYNESRFNEAQELLEKPQKFPHDYMLKLQAKYWSADCSYQLKEYDKSILMWKELYSDHKVKQLNEFLQIPYNIAFAYYVLNAYPSAIEWFDKVIKGPGVPKLLSDSYLRTGDCYYLMKDFSKAADFYSLALQLNDANADYAMYQKALAHGGQGNLEQKAENLEAFHARFPKSDLADDGLYELGTTYLIFEKNMPAISTFEKLVNDYPHSPFVRQALLKIGLTYYNTEQNQEALKVLKKVVENYAGTKESKEALISIRNIYVESNAADEFFVYVKNIPFANMTNNAQDSISYMATENVYMNGDCESAIPGFSNYLNLYPAGAFNIQAHFYRGECYIKSNEPDLALKDYEFVLENSGSAFRETALLKSARILRYNKSFDKAAIRFNEVVEQASSDAILGEGLEGLLESNYQLKNYDKVIQNARRILTSGASNESSIDKAHLYMARAALQTNDLVLAKREYSIVVNLISGEPSAEAKYQIANIEFHEGNYKESEKIIFELINEYGSYDLWVTRGFILLADIYVKYDNSFQARQTLQSIIDNQEDPELVNMAIQKKKILDEMDGAESRQKNQVENDTVFLEHEKR